jgi:adenylate cyclase
MREPVAIFEPLGAADAVDAAARAELARWHETLALVRAQRWDDADALLQALAAGAPERRLYALYRERVAVYRTRPPGPEWDGVTTFETK